MNNKDNYKNAINQIHAPEDLKKKTLEKMNKEKKPNSITPLRVFYSAVAVCFLVLLVGVNIGLRNGSGQIIEIAKEEPNKDNKDNKVKTIIVSNDETTDLPKFKDLDELVAVLEENRKNYNNSFRDIFMNSEAIEETDSVASEGASVEKSVVKGDTSDFSKTNTQVENVDEADIVKTDGNYIYYITNGKLYIVDAKSLETVSEIDPKKSEKEYFSISEMFINGNKLVLFGGYTTYDEINYDNYDNEDRIYYNSYRVNSKSFTRAIVYDISDKANLKEERIVDLEGNYRNSRMIGNNIYFISNKYIDYYNIDEETFNKEDLLPTVYDSLAEENTKVISAENIIYFPDSDEYSYTLIGGFNLDNNSSLKVETYFGASSTIYCSENNLYVAQPQYGKDYRDRSVKIYKFELNDGSVTLKSSATVPGYINDQFSMDEYEGNLRIATTVTIKDSSYNYITQTYQEEVTENRVYVLDENLNELGNVSGLAKGEKIYAVRFIGKVGYVVTFKQVDPLFVIDLSDPKNPTVKGELKIPGYSSYLHPYDENHIIGIGYNVEDNGYGGVRNTNIKMSMFDISDLENPKEMFNTTIGKDYAYSNLFNNHKALFFKESSDLIGFQYYTYGENEDYYSYSDRNIFEIFHIDLEKGFERYVAFSQGSDYYDVINRMIYIGDTLFGLSASEITAFDMNTMEKIKTLELFEKSRVEYYWRDEDIIE